MFDVESDVDLIEVMSEATRDESTSIALRLLAVGERYARRAVELVERSLWRTDPTEEVAAEISAAQKHQPCPGGGPDLLWAHVV